MKAEGRERKWRILPEGKTKKKEGAWEERGDSKENEGIKLRELTFFYFLFFLKSALCSVEKSQEMKNTGWAPLDNDQQ